MLKGLMVSLSIWGTVAVAIPIDSTKAIQGLVTTNAEFKFLFSEPGYDSLLVELADRYQVQEQCAPASYSKSGTVLKVTLNNSYQGSQKIAYFATEFEVKDFQRCKE